MTEHPDIETDTRHLYHLVCAITEGLLDIPVQRSEIDGQLERACALAWIARDLAQSISDDAGNYNPEARAMTPIRELKAQMAGETRAEQAAEQRERDAIVRAERAEQSERNLTRELDKAHRLLDLIRAELSSNGKGAA